MPLKRGKQEREKNKTNFLINLNINSHSFIKKENPVLFHLSVSHDVEESAYACKFENYLFSSHFT